ncbi:[protein-PII] uridylyltransferase [Undibacterium luofuense]|uniref:Bifunctional uridylyltransferase/uridylyl-removing enzyme n=1 Tax=Undibacterium luofuense TaxID=2828733 RepID=A0A941DL84_9BURK|nr:[protein-PII] uridylyltransferase [Undibacterium luofuense]MBR7782099.1 [protein-PII] uridylyltransferase [Undibacterium luofuense]
MVSNIILLRDNLRRTQQEAISGYTLRSRPDALLEKLCKNVDQTLQQIWKQNEIPGDISLIAVGGYGRGELFPHSDVDVLILLPASPDKLTAGKLENLIQSLWDIGLDIGHSVRTVDECLNEAASDITIQTSMLEARYICGSRKLFRELQQRYADAMNPQKFFQEKLLEMQQRHVKYEDTPYSLEPNCKESPGGLRDLQVILWVAKAANLGNSWHELAVRGLITETEARQLKRNERAFKDIRIRLHNHTKRREDRLVFDVQTPIAESLGFKTTESRRSSEYLMQRYYWAAKSVTQLNQILLQNIEAVLFPRDTTPRSIHPHFNEVNGLIDIVEDDTFEQHPETLLEVFLVMAQHSELKGMTARTLRALWHAREKIDAEYRHNIFHRALFLKLIQSPRGITHALRRMNQMSILGRYLPNFRRIVGQMQHDLFHAYTVDQHILMVVRNLRRFTLAEHAHEYPFCSQLMADFDEPWVLYIAALFHDIAKGRGGDHSELGMADARKFCYDHGLNRRNTELVIFLVQNHLTMSQVAQKQDLSDPDVIQAFADRVKDERHLTALYLLTVCDIRGTSPKVWNAWKGKLLEDLYKMTLRALGGEMPTKDRELRNRQEDALKALRLAGLPHDAHQEFWKQLDVAYFLRHDANDIAWQTRVLHDKTRAETPVVKCRLAPIGEGLQVTVYLQDQPDLFARICNYFDGKNFSILDAKIHTCKNGYALDSFLIIEPNFAQQYRDIITLIEHELSDALTRQAPLSAPNPGRLSRLSRHFPVAPSVDLRPDERGRYFLLSITANDRNGLLYSVANLLAKYKINLHTAKVMTLGERVEDVFIIDGPALNVPKTQIQFETELLEALKIN